MKNHTFLCKGVLTILVISPLLFSTYARAGAIFDVDGRFISGSATAQQQFGNDPDSDSFSIYPSSPFSGFDQADSAGVSGENANASASSDQKSSLTPTLFTAVGSASVSANSGSTSQAGASASSWFSIDFSLNQTHLASLIGEVTGIGGSPTGASSGGAGVDLVNLAGMGTELFSFGSTPDATTPFAQELILGPGMYRIRAIGSASAFFLPEISESASGSYELSFALQRVPEPGTLGLLAIAFAGIGYQQRKKAIY